MQHKTYSHVVLPLLLILSLSSCSTGSSRYTMRQDRAPKHDVNANKIADAIPRVEPRSKYGNPKSYVVKGRRYQVMKSANGYRQRGIASWYGSKFHGHRTSSGEPYNMYAMTAAHKNLPLPSYVRVTNLDNNRSVVVKVNDRGPFHQDRIIDLSYVAAKKLGINGTGRVEINVIDPRQFNRPRRVSALDNINKKIPATPAASNTKSVSANGPRVFIQVGAFSERSNADELCDQLAGILKSGEINTGYNLQHKLYRVRIGPLASAEEANKLAEIITRSGIATPKVVLD